MASFMFSSSDSVAAGQLHVSYEELRDYASDYHRLGEALDSHVEMVECAGGVGGQYGAHPLLGNMAVTKGELGEWMEAFNRVLRQYEAANKLGLTASNNRQGFNSARSAGSRATAIGNAIGVAADLVEANERKVIRLQNYATGNGAVRSDSFNTVSHAAAFYAAAAEAEKQRKESEEKYNAWLEWARENDPELYNAIMDKLAAEERAEWEAYMQKNEPEWWEWYQNNKAEQEKARKEAEAALAAMEGELADAGAGFESSLGGGSDFGSDFGGGTDFGGGSDFGGGGGFGGSDLGSVEDWAGDLLSDTIDGEELGAASAALDEVVGAASGAATALGSRAVSGATDLTLAAEEQGILGTYGPQLASFAQAYGLQAAAVLGGAAVLYATREQTTEAVAHVAEFVSTKCAPFATDVMDQVKGAARKTNVNVAQTTSKTVGVSHGREAGDLIG